MSEISHFEPIHVWDRGWTLKGVTTDGTEIHGTVMKDTCIGMPLFTTKQAAMEAFVARNFTFMVHTAEPLSR